MTEWRWQEYSIGVEVTQDALPPVRMPDPWWRKPLVAVGIVKPIYRKGRVDDLFYGSATPPKQFGGLSQFVKDDRR